MSKEAVTPGDQVARLSLRLAAIVCLALLAAWFGSRLLPREPPTRNFVRPQITVYADQPGVMSALSISLVANTDVPAISEPSIVNSPIELGYKLDFTLSILSPVTKPIMFVVVLENFPSLTGSGIVPLTWSAVNTARSGAAASGTAVPGPPVPPNASGSDLRSYLSQPFPVRPRPTNVPAGAVRAGESTSLELTSLYSLGSVSGGSKLRIVFPLIENEASLQLPSLPIAASEFSAVIKNFPSLRGPLYQPDIAPATTEYRGLGEDLSDFGELSGDPPVLAPDGGWSWSGVGNVTVLAQDLVAADDEQHRLFWSGILIGVAGGAVIAAVLELIDLVQEFSQRRKGVTEATQKATLIDEPDHQEQTAGEVGNGKSPDSSTKIATRPNDHE